MSRNRYYFPPGGGRLFFFLEQVPDIIPFHFENMDEELNAILKVHGLPEVELAQVGASKERGGRHYREFYEERPREFVRWLFMPEIQKLGYDFDFGDDDVRSP